jgi:hypothetical protein
MNKHKGKRRVQKRPNYKNVGEEEDEEKVPTEDSQEDAEKAKGTEGGSKGMKTSGEREGECTQEPRPAPCCCPQPMLPSVSSVLFLLPHVSCGCFCLSPLPTNVPHPRQSRQSEAAGGCHIKTSPTLVGWVASSPSPISRTSVAVAELLTEAVTGFPSVKRGPQITPAV